MYIVPPDTNSQYSHSARAVRDHGPGGMRLSDDDFPLDKTPNSHGLALKSPRELLMDGDWEEVSIKALQLQETCSIYEFHSFRSCTSCLDEIPQVLRIPS